MRSLAPLIVVFLLAGCARSHLSARDASSLDRPVAAGLVYRSIPTDSNLPEASVLDIDLARKDLAVRIASDRVGIAKGRVCGDCYTVREWCRRAGALGGVNGGFFGVTQGAQKEVIGLLATEGSIKGTGGLVRSPSHPDRRFARCVFGLDGEGVPRIGWAVGQRGRGAILTDYEAPLNPTKQCYWTVESAVACGPRLIANSKIRVTDREERLVSPPPLRRTFIGFDLDNGRPRHLVLGIAPSMTFQDAAKFLQHYFQTYHHTTCAEAMCLDGGSSTQLAYRTETGWIDAQPCDTTVPTAILVVKRR